MAASKPVKKNVYFKQVEEAERRFKALGLTRPQDSYPELLIRARQINFGLVKCEQHPRETIIREWKPSARMMESRKTCISIDSKLSPTWIKSHEEFLKMMRQLRQSEEVSIDVECHSHRSVKGFVALIQIATVEQDFLIDPFGLRNEITTDLKGFLENPDVLKIGHDLRNDNLWLQRDFGIFLTACNDTQVMWNLYSGEQMVSLQKLMEHFYPESLHLKAAHQTLSDWRLRPGNGMTTEQEQYATADVHVTLRIFDQLRYLLGERSQELLETSFDLAKERLLKVSGDFNKSVSLITEALLELNSPKCSKTTSVVKSNPLSLRKFSQLLEWRQQLSRILDDKPEFILPLKTLTNLSLLTKTTAEEVKRFCPIVHPRLWTTSSQKPMQAGIISNIINQEEFIETIRNLECHNCLTTGHGPAWACPFPKNKANHKKWMDRPENKSVKDNQNQRRFNNLAAKFGEEKAQAAMSSK